MPPGMRQCHHHWPPVEVDADIAMLGARCPSRLHHGTGNPDMGEEKFSITLLATDLRFG
jgi:hypothetical protein